MNIRLRAIGAVSVLTLLTNLLGFAREILTAHALGTGPNADAFVAAWSIVSACFLVFSSITIQAAFMPNYQAARANSTSASRGLFWHSFGWTAAASCVLIAVLDLGATSWVKLVLPGFTLEKTAETASLIRLLAPLMLFMTTGALLQSVSHAQRRFVAPALVPTLNNVVIIGLLILLVPKAGVRGLALAFVIGGSFWWWLLGCTLRDELFGETRRPSGETLRSLVVQGLPVMFLLLADQISALIQKTLVSGLPTGSIASLSYAAKLVGVPTGIFAVAIATVFFPALTAALQERDFTLLAKRFRAGLAGVALVSVPASVILIWAAEPLTRWIFERGAFDARATHMTANALVYYAFGLVPQGMIVYFNRTYYAAKNTRTPMWAGLISVVFSIVACVIGVKFMGYLGIALGTTIYAFAYAALLAVGLRGNVQIGFDVVLQALWRITFAGVLMYVALYSIEPITLPAFVGGSLTATAVYLVAGWLMREPLIRDAMLALRSFKH